MNNKEKSEFSDMVFSKYSPENVAEAVQHIYKTREVLTPKAINRIVGEHHEVPNIDDTMAYYQDIILDAKKSFKAHGRVMYEFNGTMKFDYMCQIHDYDRRVEGPSRIYKYFAYKEGKAQEFNEKSEALKFSKNVESVIVNKEEIDQFWSERQHIENLVKDAWKKSLRNGCDYISNEIFSKIYDKAYEDGHSAGYDEVANYFSEYMDFASDIISLHEAIKAPKEEVVENRVTKRKVR